MEKRRKQVFEAISEALGRYDNAVTDAMREYRSGKEKARADSSVYKAEDAEFARRLEGLKARTRAEIKKADEALAEAIKGKCVPLLREALGLYTAQIPNDNFIKRLRIFSEFGLKMTPAEARQLADLAADCNLALRALATVAARSGIAVNFPQVADFENDLQQLEKLVRMPVCYVPTEFLREGLELFEERPVFRADGSVAYTIKSDSIGLLLIASEFRSTFKSLGETGERWASSVVASVLPLEDGEKATERQAAAESVSVDASGANNIEIARQLGKQRADARRESEAIMNQYARK